MHKLLILSMLFTVVALQSLFSQTPEVLTSSIPYDIDLTMSGPQTGFSDVADIGAAFNNARRVEETQFCFVPLVPY